MILNIVKGNMLFQNMTNEQQISIVDTMWLKEVKSGETVIKQGDLGDHFYIVENGHFDIFVTKQPGNNTIKVTSRERGSSFGELALLYNSPRAATVTAAVDSNVWVLDRWNFRNILTTSANQKLQEYEAFLRGVSSFGKTNKQKKKIKNLYIYSISIFLFFE
jgi:cAMP-dependent protein kinase regulator